MYIVRFNDKKVKENTFRTRDEAVAAINARLADMVHRDTGCRAHIYSNGVNHFYAAPMGVRPSYDYMQRYGAFLSSDDPHSEQSLAALASATIKRHPYFVPNLQSISGFLYSVLYYTYFHDKVPVYYRKNGRYIEANVKAIRSTVDKIFREDKRIRIVWKDNALNDRTPLQESLGRNSNRYSPQATRREARREYREYLEENDMYDPTIPLF